MSEVLYGRTESGQLLYDLAFVSLSDKWIARKHKVPISEVRRLRESPAIRRLSKKVKKDKS